ncbi:dockerin type I domain-containing protein [Aporhodopirellula aestuarii]|uniref:Dockerin type I domain-containing protein n=1 Tax=Aporhodopirellula aestuarii TaxID=2950107 RepID=A0ABT0UC49_9BACT|nr:dockerin type I domain-containing protein [Aporhodopirellula aestuarii]MCM2374065.1 dockerin type I domain-containing protein [Aporhodopirellula aestuarii]
MPRPDRNRKRPRRPKLEILENRRVMAAELPFGATPQDTAEFLLGTVTVTPIFLESDGSIDTNTQNWTAGEIDAVLANITAGVNWWKDALDELDTVHSLEFIIDDTYAKTPVATGYEPIARNSNNYNKYVNEFLDFAEIDASLQLDDGMFAFNNAQREKFGTDWAFSIFIADSSEDSDGFFPSGGSFRGAFAFAGGLYMVSPSTRPSSTFAHEMGHIFWALDEYSGGGNYASSRGYYNTQNENAWDNPTEGFQQEDSIMAGYDRLVASYVSHTSAASTLALVGWQDSDGDGIFDVLDVPLNLQGSGGFNPSTSQFEFVGEASVATLENLNPSGHQSDITLNRVSRLEASIDNGPWQVIAEPNSYTATFDLDISVPSNFTRIDLRVVDAQTGITSEILSATPTTPLLPSTAGVSGYAFLDLDRNSVMSANEALLSGVTLTLQTADGNDLPQGDFSAAAAPLATELGKVDGITLQGNIIATTADVEARTVATLDDQALFHVFDPQLQFWTSRLGQRVSIQALLDEPTSYVEVDVVGMESGDFAYARIEGYDAAGNLIDRATTDLSNDTDGKLGFAETQTLRLSDPNNLIASVRIAGHADTSVAMTAIRTGIPDVLTTDAYGGFSIDDLPAGAYRITAMADNVTYGFDPIEINPAATGPVLLAATVVNSPRYNTLDPFDVSEDGTVTAVDALQIINDLNLNGSRTLTWNEATGNKIDVTNDGVITALDALRVINHLNERSNLSANSEPATASRDTSIVSHQAAALMPQQVQSTRVSDASVATETEVAGIDEVLAEPIKWISRPESEPFDTSTGLVFNDTVES